MKKIYWRPQKVSYIELILIAVIALVGIFLVETLLVREQQLGYREKIAAAKLSLDAMKQIKEYRIKKGMKIDKEADPAETGMVGMLMTPVTTNSGHLSAKQTSINPNFAAVIVHLLMKAGVNEGDVVAVGTSGSFPCMNIHVFAAIQTMKLKPIIISSASGSQWGANIPNLLWIDMEKILYKDNIFDFVSVAASRGGVDDRGLGLSKRGKNILDDSIEANGLIFIKAETPEGSLDKRMQIYTEYANENPIIAYVNIGGGTISVGGTLGKKTFKPGLNKNLPRGPFTQDSAMRRMSLDGIPVIHLVSIDLLAERYGLPLQPQSIPPIGEGKIFYKMEYSQWLPLVVLGIILVTMIAFIRMDWGFRLFQSNKMKNERKPPEQMV